MQLLLVLHVLGATVWTGGHLVLALTVLPRALAARDPAIVHAFEGGFERLALPALLVQVVTGFLLAFQRLPHPADWFSLEGYGSTHLVAKLVLLVATLALALHARLRVLPHLDEQRLGTLAWHIVPVTVLSVLFVLVGVGFRTEGIF